MKYRIRKNSISSNKFKVIKYHWILYREIEHLSVFRSAFHKIQKIEFDENLWADNAISLIGHRETETDNTELEEKFNSKRIASKVKERYLRVQNK